MKQIRTKLSNLHKLYSVNQYETEFILNDVIYIESVNSEYVKINGLVKKYTEMLECFIEGIEKPYICAKKHIIMSPDGWVHMEDADCIIDKEGNVLKILDKRDLGFQDSYDVGLDNPHMYVTENGLVHHNTFLSLYLSLRELQEEDSYYKKVIIIRSVVPSRDMGFLPGSIKEKAKVYESPYVSICADLYGRGDAYDILTNKKILEFHTSSFLRGLTFDDSIVIIDECQNMTFAELHTIITRIGENSRIILCGDLGQNDLVYKKTEFTGLIETMKILKRIKSVSMIEFEAEDIVRSGFVKEYILAKYAHDETKKME